MLGKMGDFLLRERGLESLISIRKVFLAIFPDQDKMNQMLKDELLWKLWHRRHVVVHRRGRIDEAYMRQTGDKRQETGALLNIERDEIDEIILFLCRMVREMLLSADRLLVAEQR